MVNLPSAESFRLSHSSVFLFPPCGHHDILFKFRILSLSTDLLMRISKAIREYESVRKRINSRSVNPQQYVACCSLIKSIIAKKCILCRLLNSLYNLYLNTYGVRTSSFEKLL